MQLFDRKEVDVPAGLLSDRAKKARFEVLKLFQMSESARAQTKVPVESLHNLGDSIQNALDQLFHGKCAFCESKIRGSIDVYRFRPVSDSLPADDEGSQHLYYGWLSLVWENLYPICSDCNNRDNFFPVSGRRVQLPSLAALRLCIDDGSWAEYPIQENSLLIDPCGTRKPRTSIIFHANGIFSPKNKLGKLTIEKFNLNRPKLVARRGKMMLHYVKLLKGYATAERERQPGVAERVPRIFDFKRLEFGGMWHGFLLQVCADLLGLSPSLLRRMDVDFWDVYRNHPDGASFRRRIRQAVFKRMGRDDPRIEQREESTSKNPGRFVSLKLHNFKSIEALEVKMPRSSQPRSNGTPALLILGENAVGKSTVLEAFALGLTSRENRENIGVDAEKFRLNPGYLGSQRMEPRQSSRLEFKFENEKRVVTIGEHFEVDNPSALLPVFAYGAFRQFVDGRAQSQIPSPIATLFNQDAILPNPEDWLLGLSSPEFDMVIRALREIISVEGNFDHVERDQVEKRCYVVSILNDESGNREIKTPLGLVSSGFRSVLAMTCDIFRNILTGQKRDRSDVSLDSATGIVLIDEVEAHLHPRWKMQIMRGLRNALPQMTFIVTSHDPLCLRGMEDEEIVVMRRVTEQTPGRGIAIKVEFRADLPKVNQLTIEQLLTADFFGLLSTDQPEVEEAMARISDLLARRSANDKLTSEETDTIKKFEREIAESLPIGSSEAQRLVQEAVAEYLAKRRSVTNERLGQLREKSKKLILDALEGI